MIHPTPSHPPRLLPRLAAAPLPHFPDPFFLRAPLSLLEFLEGVCVLPLLPFRAAAILAWVIILFITSSVVNLTHHYDDPPNCLVRANLLLCRGLTRLMLWGIGVWWIEVNDKRTNRERPMVGRRLCFSLRRCGPPNREQHLRPPQMIVPNHTTYIDGWVIYTLFAPMLLSKLDVSSLPIFGTIIRGELSRASRAASHPD